MSLGGTVTIASRTIGPWTHAGAAYSPRPRNSRVFLSYAARSAAAKIREDFTRGVMSGSPRDTATRMGSGATHVQTLQRSAVVLISEHRARREHLIERQCAVKYVAADETEGALEIQRALDLAPEHGGFEIRGVLVDGLDHQIRDLVAVRVPGLAIRKLRSNMLAEEARHVLAAWRQAVVQCRGNHDLHNRLARPAGRACIEIGLLHIGEGRGGNDARRMVIRRGLARQTREVRQLAERDVHAERPGTAPPTVDPVAELARQHLGGDQLLIQQF